jgi:hypothetical protein
MFDSDRDSESGKLHIPAAYYYAEQTISLS